MVNKETINAKGANFTDFRHNVHIIVCDYMCSFVGKLLSRRGTNSLEGRPKMAFQRFFTLVGMLQSY
jgi:hypothetical protein